MSGFLMHIHQATAPPRAPAAAARLVVRRDVAEEADRSRSDHAERGARVEAEPAEPEDERAEHRERDAVARDRVERGRRCRSAPMRGPRMSAPASAGERALVVHDGRAGEVLHALVEEPAANVIGRRSSRGRCNDGPGTRSRERTGRRTRSHLLPRGKAGPRKKPRLSMESRLHRLQPSSSKAGNRTTRAGGSDSRRENILRPGFGGTDRVPVA